MALMYLLGNPDHYTSHMFIPFWWKSYVSDVMRYWSLENSSHSKPDIENNTHKINQSEVLEDSDNDNVLIGLEDGIFVGTSNVDDYKYQPDIYQDMTLYEWIQTSHRRRATKKEIEALQRGTKSWSQYLPFKEGHPLRFSHLVKCNSECQTTVVPNIVGGPLPRFDQGDQEYYCCTMLTLF